MKLYWSRATFCILNQFMFMLLYCTLRVDFKLLRSSKKKLGNAKQRKTNRGAPSHARASYPSITYFKLLYYSRYIIGRYYNCTGVHFPNTVK